MQAPTLLCLAVLMATSGIWAQNETKPDNTIVNKRDRQKNEPTADQ
jgi:hyperosmotically inducible protein